MFSQSEGTASGTASSRVRRAGVWRPGPPACTCERLLTVGILCTVGTPYTGVHSSTNDCTGQAGLRSVTHPTRSLPFRPAPLSLLFFPPVPRCVRPPCRCRQRPRRRHSLDARCPSFQARRRTCEALETSPPVGHYVSGGHNKAPNRMR